MSTRRRSGRASSQPKLASCRAETPWWWVGDLQTRWLPTQINTLGWVSAEKLQEISPYKLYRIGLLVKSISKTIHLVLKHSSRSAQPYHQSVNQHKCVDQTCHSLDQLASVKHLGVKNRWLQAANRKQPPSGLQLKIFQTRNTKCMMVLTRPLTSMLK